MTFPSRLVPCRPAASFRTALLSVALFCIGGTAMAGSDPQDGRRTGDLYLQLIRQARLDGRPRAALAYLDDYDRRFSGDWRAAALRINSLLDLGQADEAEAALGAAERRLKDAGPAALLRGHIAAARGDWEAAAACYEQAMAADPAAALVRNALGYAQLRTRRTAMAVETLGSAHDLAPDDPVIRNNLALAYRLAGREAAADAVIRGNGEAREQDALRRGIAAEAARIRAAFPAPGPPSLPPVPAAPTARKP